MEVGIEVTVPDDIPRNLVAVTSTPYGFDCMPSLRAKGDGIYTWGILVLCYGVQFVEVEMEDVRLLHPGVYEPNSDGVANVSLEDGSNRISKHPGTMVLLFV